ncbi:hypothetical protein [Mycobacterium sp. 29Ha]|uniref:hypothetical protein n=1 Tax=Mycobacterium sp. 29Ha TaxID=2939268 RepID=UPI002938F95E|nr:hypothetical protein [Mycobacterium sp. 29Ha]MDV3131327.1 hypothetical protein [Mycobacterium sp. 29Ha]
MERRGFGDLEAVVKERLWEYADSVTVRDAFEEPSRRRRSAYTTGMSFSADRICEKLCVQLKAAPCKGQR